MYKYFCGIKYFLGVETQELSSPRQTTCRMRPNQRLKDIHFHIREVVHVVRTHLFLRASEISARCVRLITVLPSLTSAFAIVFDFISNTAIAGSQQHCMLIGRRSFVPLLGLKAAFVQNSFLTILTTTFVFVYDFDEVFVC